MGIEPMKASLQGKSTSQHVEQQHYTSPTTYSPLRHLQTKSRQLMHTKKWPLPRQLPQVISLVSRPVPPQYVHAIERFLLMEPPPGDDPGPSAYETDVLPLAPQGLAFITHTKSPPMMMAVNA